MNTTKRYSMKPYAGQYQGLHLNRMAFAVRVALANWA